MVDAMSRAARRGAAIGIAGALALLPFGVVPTNAGASDGATLQPAQAGQLAQAGPGAARWRESRIW